MIRRLDPEEDHWRVAPSVYYEAQQLGDAHAWLAKVYADQRFDEEDEEAWLTDQWEMLEARALEYPLEVLVELVADHAIHSVNRVSELHEEIWLTQEDGYKALFAPDDLVEQWYRDREGRGHLLLRR